MFIHFHFIFQWLHEDLTGKRTRKNRVGASLSQFQSKWVSEKVFVYGCEWDEMRWKTCSPPSHFVYSNIRRKEMVERLCWVNTRNNNNINEKLFAHGCWTLLVQMQNAKCVEGRRNICERRITIDAYSTAMARASEWAKWRQKPKRDWKTEVKSSERDCQKLFSCRLVHVDLMKIGLWNVLVAAQSCIHSKYLI